MRDRLPARLELCRPGIPLPFVICLWRRPSCGHLTLLSRVVIGSMALSYNAEHRIAATHPPITMASILIMVITHDSFATAALKYSDSHGLCITVRLGLVTVWCL